MRFDRIALLFLLVLYSGSGDGLLAVCGQRLDRVSERDRVLLIRCRASGGRRRGREKKESHEIACTGIGSMGSMVGKNGREG